VVPPDRASAVRRSARAIVVVAALALVAGACGGGKHKSSPTISPPKVLAIKTSVLKVGKVDVESAGPPNVQIGTAIGKAVLGAAQKYIDEAVFAPLERGALGSGYSQLFDSGVKPAATSADRGALTDLDVGKLTGLVTKATPVQLSALAGTLGELMYVATNFDLTVKGTGATGPLTITRHIELTFAQTGKAWLVTAYRVRSVRKSASGTTTTTAATPGTKP
jgi:hypothetical protein